jgi:hypothetical protein
MQDGRMTLAGLGWLPWRAALVLAAAMLVLMGLLSLNRRTKPATRMVGEIALILGLYAAWQFIGSRSKTGLDTADAAGMWLADVEHAIRMPSEAALQAMVLDHPSLVAFADAYYITLHIPVFVVVLSWVLVFRRRDWPFARTVVVLVTGACLLVQIKAVAPPRLLPELGIVDTAALNGRSVYSAIAGANQFGAMPSVHIAWAAVVALVVIISARSKWRWLVLAYPFLTLWVVVVTGNHFILDGVVSVALLAGAVAVTLYFPSQRPERLLPLFEPARQAERERVPSGVE